MFNHFPSERWELLRSSVFVPLSSVSIVSFSFVVAVWPILVNLHPLSFLTQLGTFKNVTEFCRTDHASRRVPRLQLLIPEMRLLHMELKIIFHFEVLIAKTALIVRLCLTSLVAKLPQLILNHPKIIQLANAAVFSHLDVVGREERFHFRINPI